MALTADQYVAIEWLAKPKKGGKTYEEIAAICNVTSRTLENWRKKPEFDAEFRRTVKRVNDVRLPELVESLAEIAITDRNAAMAKLALQVGGILTDSVEVTTKGGEETDIEALKSRLAALKRAEPETGE